MSRYIPVRQTMDSEDHYHSPYDTHDVESDAHYEAPSCLKRNPSGSLFIPSGKSPDPQPPTPYIFYVPTNIIVSSGSGEAANPGEKTLPLESRLRYTTGYSPHHTATSRSGAYSPQHSSSTGSSTREPQHVYNVGTLGTRLGNTLLSRQGAQSPARSPATETYKHLDTNRGTLPSYSSGVYHPSSSHPLHNTVHGHGHGKRPASHSGSSNTTSFRLKSDLGSRCSWKFVAIFFMLFSFLLVSALIYTAASNYIISGSTGFESAKACAVIEDSPRENVLDDSSYFTNSPVSVKPVSSMYPQSSLSDLSSGGAPVTSLPPDAASFVTLPLGTHLVHTIPSYSYWNFQLEQTESGYIQFSFAIPRGSSIGLYARKNAIPSLTINDIRDVLIGFRSISQKSSLVNWRQSRSAGSSLTREASYYLDAGHWFLSLYNDAASEQTVEMTASISQDLTSACPRGCSGHGECVLGTCECAPGYDGPDCSLSTCPVLCSNNGEYEEGACRCYPGWKGAECSIRHNECEVPDCNNHGSCVAGECQCSRGYTGQFCQQVDCVDPRCGGHGYCVAGTCVCRKGWRGETCDQVDNEELRCQPDCSGHGAWDMDGGVCHCDQGWIGETCARELCDLDCGLHGHCEGGHCVCDQGWHGNNCATQTCDDRCSQHGMCSNGTCLCTNGWNGRHCTLEGCPGNCNGHGTCSMPNYKQSWECLCESGWYGPGCDIRLEQRCDDKIDNDKDGLVDCEDPECCESPACEHSQLCHTVSAPIDILLRKQPPAVTASFYERMKFIIEDRGLQSYAKKKGFNESLFWSQFNARRAAVVRGQVVTPDGMGLIGVRVSTNGANEGFTMTRQDGWFDLMVNGGGPVMLQFGRNPYSPLRLALNVPWNEVMVLAPVKLADKEVHVQVPELYQSVPQCSDHDYDLVSPIAVSSWQTTFTGAPVSSVLAESQVVQESISIPGSNIRLMYHSSRAKGYYSTIQLQLTPDTVPETLVRVHLVISIEGVLEEKLFEADPNIKFTYAWDRLNIYRQRVYGVTTASIKVGYEYSDCAMVQWSVNTVKVPGHDMVLSDIGGWNLAVQHKYNFHEGILQKGDGSNIYLKYKPLVVTTLMGDGNQRQLECHGSQCEGEATKASLLAPKSLAVSPDGSVFVADHNLIRRISADGTVTTLLQLNSTRVSYRYHLAHRTYNTDLEMRQTVYVSLPESHMIIKIRDLEHPHPVESNFVRVIGTGERCLPGDEDNCGDGGKASEARLSYPKGIAIGPEGKVYIADGNNIRMVDELGIIHTLAGHQHHRATWKPMPCVGSLAIDEVQLNWPTDVAINPLDNTLHFIDDDMVLGMTQDGRVRIVAGRPLHCHAGQYAPGAPQSSALNQPQSIAFSATGEMYIAESDSQRINRVRRVGNNKQIETIAGKTSNCNCLDSGCKCWDPDTYLAANTRFSAISSIAVSPDGKLYVADQGNYRVRTVASVMPTSEEDTVFEVPDPDSRELYIFNRFGQHIQTKDMMTAGVLYSMEYHQSTSNGRLVSVTDASGRKLSVLRDYSGQVTALQTSSGHKIVVRINRMGYLESYEQPDGYKVQFQYLGQTGLLLSKLDSQNYGLMFQYDQYGRLIQAVAPTGELTQLTFNLTSAGGDIKVGPGDRDVISVQDNSVTQAGADKVTVLESDRSLVVREGDVTTVLASVRHPVISHSQPIIGASYPMVGEMRVELGQSLISKVEWDYSLQTSGHDKQMLGISKKIQVNGENLLMVTYDKLQRRELLYLADKTELLEIKYDEQRRPVTMVAPGHHWAPVSQRYDRFGHLQSWRWGDISEDYAYDKEGRLSMVRAGNDTVLTYEYKDRDVNPSKVSVGTGAAFSLDYDGKSGGVRSVATTKGHVHRWSVKPDIGSVVWSYYAPWSPSQSYSVNFNARGDILSEKLAGGNEQVLYAYTSSGQLQSVFCGQTEIEFEDANSVFVSQGNFELREKRKYHGGMLKEQKLRYAGLPGLDNANIKYQLDGTGRLARVNAFFGRRESLSATWKYNQNTGALEAVGNLQIRKVSYNKTEIGDNSFGKTVQLDQYGNIKNIVYKIKKRNIFGLELEYNAHNRLGRKLVVDHEGRSHEEQFQYSKDGQLGQVMGPTNFRFKYDETGNLMTYSKADQNINVVFGAGDRVENFGRHRVMYDSNGFVTSIDGQKLLHNGLGQLVEMVTSSGVRLEYFYDQAGRLAAWSDSTGQITQYFYTNPVKPRQVTYVHNPRNDMTQKLTYDHNDHLLIIETSDEQLYVACDQLGSPVLLFKANGNVVKHIKYGPFGEVMEDSQPSMNIPIGYRGGLASVHSTLLHMPEGRIYDPSITQWLQPDWKSLMSPLQTPFQLFLYRFQNNNPLSTGAQAYMTSMLDWAALYGYDMTQVFHASHNLHYYNIQLPQHRIQSPGLLAQHAVLSELDTLVARGLDSVHDLRFIHSDPEVVEARRVPLLPRFYSQPSNFGTGFLLSLLPEDNKAVVNPVEVQNSVVQKIFESVLNNSFYLDLSYSESGRSVYYFVKPSLSQFSLDSDTTRRLAGEFTVSPRDIDNGKELSIVNSVFEVRILYGSSPSVHRSELLKQFNNLAVQKAWLREKDLVSQGFSGTGHWSPVEAAELVSATYGRIRGVETTEIQSSDKYPGLARDGTNVEFVKAGQRNRKNRHGRRSKHILD